MDNGVNDLGLVNTTEKDYRFFDGQTFSFLDKLAEF